MKFLKLLAVVVILSTPVLGYAQSTELTPYDGTGLGYTIIEPDKKIVLPFSSLIQAPISTVADMFWFTNLDQSIHLCFRMLVPTPDGSPLFAGQCFSSEMMSNFPQVAQPEDTEGLPEGS